jgi:hypothetical protein
MYYTTDIQSDEKLNLKSIYPNWAFPNGVPSDAFLTENNLTAVDDTPVGVVDTQVVVEVALYQDDNNNWKSYKVYDRQVVPSTDQYLQKVVDKETPEVIDGVWTMFDIVDLTDDEQWILIREKRDWLLETSDYTHATDNPTQLSTDAKKIWATYRQSLRDLPADFTNPNDVVYPDVPQ